MFEVPERKKLTWGFIEKGPWQIPFGKKFVLHSMFANSVSQPLPRIATENKILRNDRGFNIEKHNSRGKAHMGIH